jgi:uncharacterized lipoprotein YmbA
MTVRWTRFCHVRACAALLLAGCAAAPPLRFHTLMPPPGSATAAAPAAVPWQLAFVGLPVQVDRPQLVLRNGDGSMAVLEQERWIAPLGDELRAALTEGLSRRLGPPASAGAWDVGVDVQRFESVAGRLARIDAAWSVRRGDAVLRCLTRIEEPVGAGTVALAAGHREVVQALADGIADAAAALSAGRPAGCPPGRS